MCCGDRTTRSSLLHSLMTDLGIVPSVISNGLNSAMFYIKCTQQCHYMVQPHAHNIFFQSLKLTNSFLMMMLSRSQNSFISPEVDCTMRWKASFLSAKLKRHQGEYAKIESRSILYSVLNILRFGISLNWVEDKVCAVTQASLSIFSWSKV